MSYLPVKEYYIMNNTAESALLRRLLPHKRIASVPVTMVSPKSLFLAILATGATATASADEADVCNLGKQTPAASLPKPFKILVQHANFTGPRIAIDLRVSMTTEPNAAVHATLKNNNVFAGGKVLFAHESHVASEPVDFVSKKRSLLLVEAIKICDTVTKKPVTILRTARNPKIGIFRKIIPFHRLASTLTL